MYTETSCSYDNKLESTIIVAVPSNLNANGTGSIVGLRPSSTIPPILENDLPDTERFKAPLVLKVLRVSMATMLRKGCT